MSLSLSVLAPCKLCSQKGDIMNKEGRRLWPHDGFLRQRNVHAHGGYNSTANDCIVMDSMVGKVEDHQMAVRFHVA